VNLEVDPSATQKILLSLDKTCDANDEATWKMSFELQEGSPLATVVKLEIEIDPENHPQAEATANSDGLDNNQQGQAKIAATIAKDPTVSDDDKKDPAKVKTYNDAKAAFDDYTRQAKLEPLAVKLSDSVGHNRVAINFMWTLVTGFLVMFMQAGFAMVETGLCRAKNAAHVMATNFMRSSAMSSLRRDPDPPPGTSSMKSLPFD
jgi:hypothetical protein